LCVCVCVCGCVREREKKQRPAVSGSAEWGLRLVMGIAPAACACHVGHDIVLRGT